MRHRLKNLARQALARGAWVFPRHPALMKRMVRSATGQSTIIVLLALLAANPSRFLQFFFLILAHGTPADFSAIADRGKNLAKFHDFYGLVAARLFFLNRAQRYNEVLRELAAKPALMHDDALLTQVRIDALFHEGRNKEVIEEIARTNRDPQFLRGNSALLLGSIAAACCKRQDVVADCFARLTGIRRDFSGKAKPEDVWREVANRTLAAMPPLDYFELATAGRVGFFYHNMPHMLGHALHEPFFFLSMYRHLYDVIYIVGGDLASYQPGPRACMEIVNQYCRYIATQDEFFHQLAHVDLGHYRHGPLGFHAMHNWSLMREATLRTRDPADSFRLGDWRMTLPERFTEQGQSFCHRYRIDLDRPIVAFHVRSHDFHQIQRQALRNASVGDYIPALEWLLAEGYQVVRLGDASMPRLHFDSPHYHELPFMERYSAELDPFFVARAKFMMTSPSGPLTYACAFGTPMLVPNAILNYLHATPTSEMHCMKVYVETRTGRALSLEEAIRRRLFLHIHEPELLREGYSVRDASPGEILASVRDMIAWLDQPDIPLTAEQERFTQLADRMSSELRSDGALEPPIADFIGFSLSNFRISPSVAIMRGDFAVGDINIGSTTEAGNS